MRTDVNTCDCARGCTDTVRLRESALKVDSGRNFSCRTGGLNLRLRRAGPTLYRLSYNTGSSLEGDWMGPKSLEVIGRTLVAVAGRTLVAGFTSTESIKAYEGRGNWGGGGREFSICNTYLLNCHHQNDSALRSAAMLAILKFH